MASRVWWIPCAALVPYAAGLWHLMLHKQHLDRPLVVAAALLLAFALVVVTRAAVLRAPSGPPQCVRRACAALAGARLLWIAAVLLLLFTFYWGFERAASDGREYFVQVRSLVVDGDLDFRNENVSFGVRGTAHTYAFGAPLLWVPFFVAAHLWFGVLNLFGGEFPMDGFANPYQRAIGLGSLMYGVAGLWLIHRILRDLVSESLASLSTFAVAVGSFIVWYLVIENSMTHAISLFATTLFLYTWHRTRRRRTVGQWALLGATVGLMAMVRWQNGLFAIAPLVLDVTEARAVRTSIRTLVVSLAIYAGSALLAFGPQLVFWRITRGAWLGVPAADHAMNWIPTHMEDVLFSPNHGLLSWHPLVYLGLLGLPLLCRRDWRLGAVLIVGFLAQVYVNGAVENWWGGSGFGARRFASSGLVFAAGFACLLEWLRHRPLVAPAVIVGAFCAGNVMFMADVRSGRLPAGQGVSFEQLHQSFYRRLGNPFSFPVNAYVAWRHGASLSLYDRLLGRTYTNVVVDIGAADDDRLLVSGWSGRERSGSLSFRWSDGLDSTWVAPLTTPLDYALELVCAPFRFPDAPTQAITVFVNDVATATVSLREGWQTYVVPIPAPAFRENINLVRFHYRYATSPQAAGLSADPRPLAVQFDRISLINRPRE